MTGEITLRGRVLPIGGLKEKLLAAKNAGIRMILIPKENERDIEEMSSEITKGLKIVSVSHMDEVLSLIHIYYTVRGAHGIPVQTEDLITEIDFKESDMIVLPGGMPGTTNLKEDENVRKAVQEAYDDGRYVAAICAAPTILADMGLLKGKRATCYPDMESEIEAVSYTHLSSFILRTWLIRKTWKSSIILSLRCVHII